MTFKGAEAGGWRCARGRYGGAMAFEFDQGRSEDLRRVTDEIADLGHNLKRVMDHLGIAYERNPLIEISPNVLQALQRGDDQTAVESAAAGKGMSFAAATEFLRVIKPRLGLGPLDLP